MASRHFCVTYFEKKWGGAAAAEGIIRDGWSYPEITSAETLTTQVGRDTTHLRYMVWQLEECPETTQRHLQMYLEFEKPQRFAAVKKMFREHPIHIEPRKGTRDQAREYCMKEASRAEGPWEWGNWQAGGQGKRNDVAELAELAKQGATDLQLIESNPAAYSRSMKMLDRLKVSLPAPDRWDDLEVVVYWGEPGTGKSKAAWKVAREGAALYDQEPYAMTDSTWWDGYDCQKVIIFDDFYGTLKYQQILKVLDGYPMKVEIKGGHKNFHGRKFVITSNQHPKYWYKTERKDLNALKRRIHDIYHYTWKTELDGTKTPAFCLEDAAARAEEDWNAAAAVEPTFFHPPA